MNVKYMDTQAQKASYQRTMFSESTQCVIDHRHKNKRHNLVRYTKNVIVRLRMVDCVFMDGLKLRSDVY